MGSSPDLDRVSLDEVYGWSKIREEALYVLLYSPEAKYKYSERAKRYWSDPEYRRLQSKSHTGNPSSLRGVPVPEKVRNKISETLKRKGCKPPGVLGRVKVTKEAQVKYVPIEQLSEYLSQGYERTIKHYIKKGTFSATGKVWVTRGDEDRGVPKDSLDEWLKAGYVLGYSEKHRKRLSESHKRKK